ncbi:hypothetical protein BC835DRAFT_330763 [Cytidiella melzeri]|nr:hypothetical protein BC835DRAFT_330763 [Cytidiella melzeri]
MFAGSANSLHSFEVYTLGCNKIDHVFRPVLPAIQSITIGCYDCFTPDCILNELSTAPRLEYLNLCGAGDSAVRQALVKASTREGSFFLL